MRAVRFSIYFTLLLGLTVGLCGCFSWYDDAGNNYGNRRADDAARQQTSRAYQTAQQYSMVTHKHSTLALNQFLSDQVASMDGVRTSFVVLADNTAYVAILIDGTAHGTNGKTSESNNPRTSQSLYHSHESLNGDPYNSSTSSNAYATVPYHDQISHLFKQKIAEKIRALQPTVSDVYISGNRDYINELNFIARESWKGNDLSPYINEFDSWSERIFGTMPTIPTQSEQ
jgi:hypothetical protein